MSYSRLTKKDRIRISEFRKQGKSKSEIARLLGFHRSTISREIKRNFHFNRYNSYRAHNYAKTRQKVRRYSYKLTPETWSLIEERLKLRWSPEQIYNRLKLEGENIVSIETIYRYVYIERKLGGHTWQYLRRAHRVRRRRLYSRNGHMWNDPTSIRERSEEINQRKNIGHWERDTMLGKGHAAGVLIFTERKTRYNKFIKIKKRNSIEVTDKTIKVFKTLPCKSLTNDRGLEFSDHRRCAEELGVKIYFCDPYSSYQRGSNENRIGILRQYLHKQFNVKKLTEERLSEIENEINNRPMKCLDWKTPSEVMLKEVLH